MHRHLAADPQFVERFEREAKAAAKVVGPEVVAIYDTGVDPASGLGYIVMELVEGPNLRQQLLTQGRFAPAAAMDVMERVLRALALAHRAGLIHRDIKPENVLCGEGGGVGSAGRVKVTDFGLARAAASTSVTQTTTHLIGSVAYLSPEQVERGTADARSDVYAAGVLLFELLTGQPPHAGETAYSVAHKHVSEDVPAPSTVVSGIPADLDALVVRATRRDPEQRPRDGGAFLDELLAVRATLPADAAVTTVLGAPQMARTLVVPRVVDRTPASPQEPRRSRRGLYAVAVLVVLALLALFGGYYLGSMRYTKAPNLIGASVETAQAKVKAAGLGFKRDDTFSETVPVGTVISQDPKAGARVRKSGTITVDVSKGPDRRTVPSLTGLSITQALTALQNRGLKADPQPSEYSTTVANNKVIRTDPGAGTKLKPGTTVKVFVSKGPEPIAVPNLAGKSQQDATSQLTGLGFKVAVTQTFSDNVPQGTVISNNPNSGTAPKGSTVTLTVSKGPDVVPVPDVVGKKPAEATKILEAAGFKVERRDAFFSRGKQVYATDPSAGTKAKRGSTVTIGVY
jgi:serine/threonine-protein kinase